MCNQLREELISFCDDNSPNRFTTCCLEGQLIVEGAKSNPAPTEEIQQVNQPEVPEQNPEKGAENPVD